MSLVKHESEKRVNDFVKKNRSVVMNLLMHNYSIAESDAEDILQDACLLLMEKIAVGELPDVPEKLSAYLTKVCTNKAHEYFRKKEIGIQNPSFDDESFTTERLTAYEKEAQSWAEFEEECERNKQRRLVLMEKELNKLSPRERALVMGFYGTDGSKASMTELAQRLGYSSDRVAITLKSRIMRKLRTGILQQEKALGNGLSPVARLNASLPNRFCYLHIHDYTSLTRIA